MSIKARSCLQGMSSGRVTVSGRVAILEGAEAADAKSAFLAKNPQSFWVEFGDFSWFRMDNVVTARLVGGFGRIKQVRNASTSDTVLFCHCTEDVNVVNGLPADMSSTLLFACRYLQRNLLQPSQTLWHSTQLQSHST